MGIGVAWSPPPTPTVIGLAIPEDDTTPYTPLQVLAEGNLEALDPQMALGADPLRLG